MVNNEDSVKDTLKIIFNSKRTMPAHFTSNGDRTKSFCIDFDIAADDEYELASQAYYSLWEFVGKMPGDQISKSDTNSLLKIGEDITLGAFILQKSDEYASFSSLRQETIEENIRLWDSSQLKNIVDIPLIQNYFDFCAWFGRARANGFRWGK